LDYFLEMLEKSPILQEFAAHLYYYAPVTMPAKGTYPRLKTMKLTYVTQTDADRGRVQTFIDAIRLPNLEHLHCLVDAEQLGIDPGRGIYIHPFLADSQPPLSTLHLNIPISEDDIIDCLPLLPQLTSLKLSSRYGRVGEGIFKALSPEDICPKLTHLHIGYGRDIFPDSVKMFLLSRCPHPDPRDGATADCAHLENVTVTRCTWRLPPRLHDDHLLQLCFQHGLELCINQGD